MEENSFLIQLLVYMASALIFVPIAKRLGMGSVLGYIIAGIVIGPSVLGLIHDDSESIMHVAEFGIIMMLFLIGLELEPEHFWSMRKSIFGMGGLQLVLTTALVFVPAFFGFHLSWQASLASGLIFSMSSTALAIQVMTEKGLMKQASGRAGFSVLLFQDIAVIPILALFPLLSTGESASSGNGPEWMHHLAGWQQTLLVFGAVGIVIVIGRFVAVPLLRFVARLNLRELFTITALLLVTAITVLMTSVGLSPALGTFLAGVVLANTEYRHELESDIEPFKGLLLGLFFIAVGSSVDFALIGRQPGLVSLLVFGTILLKGAILFAIARIFRLHTDQRLYLAAALCQVGEFAFVLIAYARQESVFGQETGNIMVASVAISMAVSTLLMFALDRWIIPRIGTKESERAHDDISESNPVIIAGFGRFGNIAGRFLKANGVPSTILDLDSDRVDILRKMGFKVYYGDASRLDLLISAGAAKAEMLIVAMESEEKSLELIETAKKHFPHLHILVRADDRFDAYDIMDAGILHIYRETIDTSLRLAKDALVLLGHRAYTVERAAKKFLKHDEKALKKLAAQRHDKQQYILTARESIEELENILISDLAVNPETATDKAWDSLQLRKEVLTDQDKAG
ncbi:MAG: cation:proton antiporter [Mucilaginibacter polytrichastri]|nr:cation:proton antiporter [Mucilaginibacter polytrichastri]